MSEMEDILHSIDIKCLQVVQTFKKKWIGMKCAVAQSTSGMLFLGMGRRGERIITKLFLMLCFVRNNLFGSQKKKVAC